MAPTIAPNEIVVADMKAFAGNKPQRWDVVVFHPPASTLANPEEFWVMRIIGLPGESLEIRTDGIFVDGKPELLPAKISGIRYSPTVGKTKTETIEFPYRIATDTYFLVGDNTDNALDSRFWGSLPRQQIEGRVKGK